MSSLIQIIINKIATIAYLLLFVSCGTAIKNSDTQEELGYFVINKRNYSNSVLYYQTFDSIYLPENLNYELIK